MWWEVDFIDLVTVVALPWLKDMHYTYFSILFLSIKRDVVIYSSLSGLIRCGRWTVVRPLFLSCNEQTGSSVYGLGRLQPGREVEGLSEGCERCLVWPSPVCWVCWEEEQECWADARVRGGPAYRFNLYFHLKSTMLSVSLSSMLSSFS